LGIPVAFARTVMGISGALVHDELLRSSLGSTFSTARVFALYQGLGVLMLVLIALMLWLTSTGGRIMKLARANALFTVSLLSLMAWSAFAFAWEPATPHYWVLCMFPGLLCLGILMRESGWRGERFLLGALLVLSVWNLFSNRYYDGLAARSFPDVLIANIDRHLGPHDIFIVLGNDGSYSDVDYPLLSEALRYRSRNPEVTIMNDFFLPAKGEPSWQDNLREKIDSTLASGGKVYVASHLLDRNEYADLSQAKDPFSEQIQAQYLRVDGENVYPQVVRFFASYQLKASNFSLVDDDYYLLQRK
jgi:hypothetical protein